MDVTHNALCECRRRPQAALLDMRIPAHGSPLHDAAAATRGGRDGHHTRAGCAAAAASLTPLSRVLRRVPLFACGAARLDRQRSGVLFRSDGCCVFQFGVTPLCSSSGRHPSG
eukprot:TRINITY_DN1711_c0_g1_i5.p2 TRINITY_DN1711_c0_g1~~TRINITY_DN1711_c0_g1_i5.p2  ORF type:complete len:113 (+),score=16.90 TRINITY_DN1711_c0_g1_i5:21-359(+)